MITIHMLESHDKTVVHEIGIPAWSNANKTEKKMVTGIYHSSDKYINMPEPKGYVIFFESDKLHFLFIPEHEINSASFINTGGR